MSGYTPLWVFTEHVSLHRAALMLSVTSWDAVRKIVDERTAVELDVETRNDLRLGGEGALRASVKMVMSEPDADVVYNSPVGIRAQYCLGVGCERNRELIELVRQKLSVQCCEALSGSICLSLGDTDAKVCIDSADIPDTSQIHINYRPWIEKIGEDECLANTGVLAPELTNIWIKGAWILGGKVWRDPVKAGRHAKLARFGFA